MRNERGNDGSESEREQQIIEVFDGAIEFLSQRGKKDILEGFSITGVTQVRRRGVASALPYICYVEHDGNEVEYTRRFGLKVKDINAPHDFVVGLTSDFSIEKPRRTNFYVECCPSCGMNAFLDNPNRLVRLNVTREKKENRRKLFEDRITLATDSAAIFRAFARSLSGEGKYIVSLGGEPDVSAEFELVRGKQAKIVDWKLEIDPENPPLAGIYIIQP